MEQIVNFLKKEVPGWLRNLSYIVLVVETVIVLVIYFSPETWSQWVLAFS